MTPSQLDRLPSIGMLCEALILGPTSVYNHKCPIQFKTFLVVLKFYCFAIHNHLSQCLGLTPASPYDIHRAQCHTQISAQAINAPLLYNLFHVYIARP